MTRSVRSSAASAVEKAAKDTAPLGIADRPCGTAVTRRVQVPNNMAKRPFFPRHAPYEAAHEGQPRRKGGSHPVQSHDLLWRSQRERGRGMINHVHGFDGTALVCGTCVASPTSNCSKIVTIPTCQTLISRGLPCVNVILPATSARDCCIGTGVAAKVLAVAAFIIVTNFGFLDRVSLLAQNGRWATLLPFLAVWGLCVAALYVAAFQPRFSVRALWAIPIALSTACAWSYFEASKSDLNVFDVVSLWSARHEASRAAEFYSSQLLTALVVLVAGLRGRRSVRRPREGNLREPGWTRLPGFRSFRSL